LNSFASARIDALFAAHGVTIEGLVPAKRAAYERIRGAAPDPTINPLHLPQVIEFTRGDTSWSKHLYADTAGEIPLDFNSWETETLLEELKDGNTVAAWLRNVPRKD
jgi:hypothetical protein